MCGGEVGIQSGQSPGEALPHKPVADQRTGQLVVIDGVGTPDSVFALLTAAVDAARRS